MNDEYRNLFYSRISKYNCANRLQLKMMIKLCFFCILSLLCGYLIHLLSVNAKEKIYDIMYHHFCYFYDGTEIFGCIKSTVAFALNDILPILSVAILGYTMLSGFGSKLILFVHGAKIGWCGAFIYDFLITDRCITGSTGAFILFILCKLSVLTALIFASLQSLDFSYKFCEMFGKCRHPFFEKKSIEYIKIMISTAGFTALINTIYLIFQSFSGLTPL